MGESLTKKNERDDDDYNSAIYRLKRRKQAHYSIGVDLS